MNYKFLRALNNNAVLAEREDGAEVILMGKGIGFGSPKSIAETAVERSYFLSDYHDKSAYLELLNSGDPKIFEAVSEIILQASEVLGELHPSIFPVLSGHVEFAIRRIREGMIIENPLLNEIRSLYQEEYHVALRAIELLNQRLDIFLHEEEAGYIALHLGAARTNQDVKATLRLTNAINEAMIEIDQVLELDLRQGPNYRQTVELLRGILDRATSGQVVTNALLNEIEIKLTQDMKLARQVSQRLEAVYGCTIARSEIGYLAYHLNFLRGLAKE